MIESSAIKAYFTGLHRGLIERLTFLDPEALHAEDSWQREEGGGGLSHVITDGRLVEKGGVNFSHVTGASLPPSATKTRPQLANRPFEAMGVSVVFHPQNPFVPCTHMNVRYFSTRDDTDAPPIWWFGGGFDLTPCYGFEEDAITWHQAAHDACAPFGNDLYPRFKAACDQYFHLPHRGEARGIGGLFFDDFDELGPQDSFSLTQSIGNAFLPAWEGIALKRKNTPYNHDQKSFQKIRRGRYVEFNLLYDRGTLFGLQSNGRTESILMSLPPQVQWAYNHTPVPGSPEESLVRDFLKPRDWISS
ncbi:oxygen-dependent coproporphyrinogen oxidase [Puniceicoccales bacterium CK1056]|uniref:coproporphyrinogen oxidase n=2 Tax=Oceanipulchritudo coccoides TaxID=2706888 RepID=A0A6B2M1T0_9BACT|nr:oxygen-dependent coproporphyrinogen oxidase [Oceanipulchritudo coccoides]NDV61745.1 oxygen-dependent coproporphyrinogen oxidase [Oceanipulchritudo coccoides]